MNNDLHTESFADYAIRILSGLAGFVLSIVFLIGGLGITGALAWALYQLAKQGAPIVDLLAPAGVFIVAGIVLHLINMAILLFFWWISPRRRGGEYDRLAGEYGELEAKYEKLWDKHFRSHLDDDED